MSKRLNMSLMIMVLVLMVPPQLIAEIRLTGYYRLQGTAEDLSKSQDGDTSSFIDQRLRLKLIDQLSENVQLVYFGEVDTPWGEASKGNIGGGGRQSGDGVNFETKNAYLDYQQAGLNFVLGLQNMGDHVSDLVIDNDVAGMTVKSNFKAASLVLRYAKLYENERSSWDDVDFYAAQTNFKILDSHTIGLEMLFFDDHTRFTPEMEAADAVFDPAVGTWRPGHNASPASGGATRQLYSSLNTDLKWGDTGFSGWILYGTEEKERDSGISTDDTDGSSWAASAQIERKFDKGTCSVRAIYYAPTDHPEDDVFNDDHGTGFQFYKEGLSLFLTDVYYNNGSQGALYQDAAHAGYGLTALTAKGDHGLPDAYYIKWAIGYFASARDTAHDEEATKRRGKTMGTEFDLMVGKKMAEIVDLSLRGGYAFLGDFYDEVTGGQDPENPWKIVGMVNVAF